MANIITPSTDLIVCPFAVAVDTREQAPYTFDGIPVTGASARDRGKRMAVETRFIGLRSGDYSIVGLEDRIAIERKSLEDCFSTLGQGRERFEEEFKRLSEMDFAAVVIEADIRTIWNPTASIPGWRSKLNPRSVEGTIVAWSLRYPKVHWWAMGSRRAAEIRTFGVLERFWRMNGEAG